MVLIHSTSIKIEIVEWYTFLGTGDVRWLFEATPSFQESDSKKTRPKKHLIDLVVTNSKFYFKNSIFHFLDAGTPSLLFWIFLFHFLIISYFIKKSAAHLNCGKICLTERNSWIYQFRKGKSPQYHSFVAKANYCFSTELCNTRRLQKCEFNTCNAELIKLANCMIVFF